MATQPQKFHMLPKIINGGVAGIVGVAIVFPLDLVKTRLQNQQIGPNGEKLYNNMFDCFKKTFKSEGLFGLYRGSFINILLITPEKSIKLTANDYFRFLLTDSKGRLPVSSQVLAGASAGMLQFTVTTPMELLKIQMQDAGRLAKLAGQSVETTTMGVIKKIYRDKGFTGFYRGGKATIMRDVPFSMLYFPLFALLDDMGPRKLDQSGGAQPWVSFLAGLTSGAISAVAVTPCDVVKTRLQALEKAKGENQFNGIFDCFRKTLQNEGPKALFKGGLCRAIVIAPLFGIANTVYFFKVGEFICGVKKGD